MSEKAHLIYPAGLNLAGRRVVVVGGGAVAQRRLPGLLAAGADVLLIAPHVTPSIEAMAAAGEIRWERRPYRPGDLEHAWYALALTDSPEVNAAVAAEAQQRRVFCVRADQAHLGTARTPATGRHDEITVAVLSGDPRRSAAVRDAVVESLREGTLAAPHHREKRPGVALVGGGPGDPELITVRGRRLLAEADVVVVDRLAPRALLDELPPYVEVVDAAKIPYGRAMAQEEINRIIVERAKAGKFVVRLKGGDSFVFGRGYEEVIACAEAGVPVTVVPGITSAIAVPALAGIPVTHRGIAHEYTVVSGHVDPDSPKSLVDWPALARLRGTLVLLMAVERLGAIAKTLIEHGRDADTPAAVIQDGTLPGERVVRATLGTIAEAAEREGVRPPAVVVIGDVVRLSALGG
ncbi:uroporphyrinogen-III C-methyltransferase [Carbonactinospora thermoautotrophica]|uniref:uroporphyrinogen-III C-methyltransferase n=1 Tax=Carbonactinospora thermoautotrophica TaxID=1469144 RepID=UPI00226DCD96|nr:uroporphyrinogen-III C-methyltransferase [Carbonactinospora thermoautotrophica]MCX9190640.1 uroporphyrinogen-III C-methyltransferase [Carbonactinospora thermoautotrophica]